MPNALARWALLSLSLVASPALAATYTISPGESVPGALRQLRPGDTLMLRGGTYHIADRAQFTMPCGTTLRNTGGQAILHAPSGRATMHLGSGQCGNILVEGSSPNAIVLRGVRANFGDYSNDSKTGGHHITLRRVELTGTNSHMITGGAHHNHLDQVTVHDNKSSHCMYVHWNDSIVENSRFFRCENYAIHWRNSKGDRGGKFDCDDCGTHRNIIRNNELYDNGTTALNLAHGSDNEVHHNTVWGNKHAALNIGGVRNSVHDNKISGRNIRGVPSSDGNGPGADLASPTSSPPFAAGDQRPVLPPPPPVPHVPTVAPATPAPRVSGQHLEPG